jgi:predicted transcriptional regulator
MPCLARVLEHSSSRKCRAFGALLTDDGRERIQPLTGFLSDLCIVRGGAEKLLRLG